MRLKHVAMLTLSMFAGANTFAADNFSANQEKMIEKLVHDYLVKNPEVLVEASQALQAKQQKEMQQEASVFIQNNAQTLLSEKITVAGAEKANVTVIEFFDYQCGHCQKMNPIMKELLSKNKNVKVVYREFPIFGKTSVVASQAAIAAGLQGKYVQMQQLLFSEKKIDDKVVLELAKKAGLDMTKFQADMKGQVVNDLINQNRKLAESMKLFGTPVFIVMATPNGQFNAAVQPVLIPGSTSLENFQSMINKVAEAK
ncbi:MAG: DsbA family protein [Gammaproteobacteria bacterium]|nr:DsbA family protein [Gammaproteobacteria bacterium]